jgi:RNA polymerase sigma-70 factor (ECF subfamily)
MIERWRMPGKSGPNPADPDTALMARVRDGDVSAFHELFEKHGRSVVNFVFRFTGGDRSRAEDIAQDVFLQIFRARARYEPRARFTTYLYRVAVNACLNARRRTVPGCSPLEVAETHGHLSMREPPEGQLATPEERVAALEDGARIQSAIDRLPINQRSAFLLARIDGFSYAEVAESLGTSESAVKSLIFRATQTLRHELEDLLNGGPPESTFPVPVSAAIRERAKEVHRGKDAVRR